MTTPMKIDVRGLFATPVALLEIPDAATRNVELTSIILARRDAEPTVAASNAGGWHSDRTMMEWGGRRLAEILEIAMGMASQLTADRHGAAVRPAWQVTAWANVNGAGDGNICHYHPASFWSGSYYVADGGCATDAALGGELELLDPRGPGPRMYAPTLKFPGEDAAAAIRPSPGLLVLFPAWLYHQVRPYRGAGLRISIAFNLGIDAGAAPGARSARRRGPAVRRPDAL